LKLIEPDRSVPRYSWYAPVLVAVTRMWRPIEALAVKQHYLTTQPSSQTQPWLRIWYINRSVCRLQIAVRRAPVATLKDGKRWFKAWLSRTFRASSFNTPEELYTRVPHDHIPSASLSSPNRYCKLFVNVPFSSTLRVFSPAPMSELDCFTCFCAGICEWFNENIPHIY